MKRLEGKTAVVTGASKGLGAAIARKLASEGAAVVVNYARSEKEANQIVQDIAAQGGNAVAVQADVSQREHAQALFRAAREAFGPVDILVNNAGVYEFRPLEAIDEAHIDRHFDINVKGLLFATQEAARDFDGTRDKVVVNISSIVSLTPAAYSSVYAATKGAVDVITKALAAELGPRKVRVLSVAPGPVETEGFLSTDGHTDIAASSLRRTPLGRIGQPDDIAELVGSLVSSESRWLTGAVIPAAGGLTL
jgi:3-oxoacyl-[acyl-carrier protein] reductase